MFYTPGHRIAVIMMRALFGELKPGLFQTENLVFHNDFTISAASFSHCPGHLTVPVSYTHLDVYKRQL